jgi:hypothetical protein
MAEEKKKRRLSEIFSRFIPVSGAQRELFQLAEEASVRIDSAHRMVEVNFHLPRIFPKTVLYETDDRLCCGNRDHITICSVPPTANESRNGKRHF